MFYNGGEKFKQAEIILETEINLKKYQIRVFQKDIVLAKETSNKDDDVEESFPLTEEITSSFISNSLNYEISIHNDWLKGFGSFIKELLTNRKNYVLDYFKE